MEECATTTTFPFHFFHAKLGRNWVVVSRTEAVHTGMFCSLSFIQLGRNKKIFQDWNLIIFFAGAENVNCWTNFNLVRMCALFDICFTVCVFFWAFTPAKYLGHSVAGSRAASALIFSFSPLLLSSFSWEKIGEDVFVRKNSSPSSFPPSTLLYWRGEKSRGLQWKSPMVQNA